MKGLKPYSSQYTIKSFIYYEEHSSKPRSRQKSYHICSTGRMKRQIIAPDFPYELGKGYLKGDVTLMATSPDQTGRVTYPHTYLSLFSFKPMGSFLLIFIAFIYLYVYSLMDS